MLKKLKIGDQPLSPARILLIRSAVILMLVSLCLNVFLALFVWRTGYTKAELKVCQAWNESNHATCLGLADSLKICNSNLGTNVEQMQQAVQNQIVAAQQSLENQKSLEDKINEVFKNYEMGDDCLYPDDIANIMFTAKNLQDSAGGHGNNEGNQD